MLADGDVVFINAVGLDFDSAMHDIVLHAARDKHIVMHINHPWTHQIHKHQLLSDQLVSLGFHREHKEWPIYACFTQALYQTAPALTDYINTALAATAPMYALETAKMTAAMLPHRQSPSEMAIWSANTVLQPDPIIVRLQSAATPAATADSTGVPVAAPWLGCLQFRRGKDEGVPFHDTESMAPESSLLVAVKLLAAATRKHFDQQKALAIAAAATATVATAFAIDASVFLFVTSDQEKPSPSQMLHDELQQLLSPSEQQRSVVFVLPGHVEHVDRANGTHAGFMKTVADNWLLGLCDSAIVSSSGFGIAGLQRTARAEQALYILLERHGLHAGKIQQEFMYDME